MYIQSSYSKESSDFEYLDFYMFSESLDFFPISCEEASQSGITLSKSNKIESMEISEMLTRKGKRMGNFQPKSEIENSALCRDCVCQVSTQTQNVFTY